MANLSYSYNDPWGNLGNSSTPSGVALLADKSNAYDTETGARNPKAGDSPIQNEDGSWDDEEGTNPRHGNSKNHRTKFQNVLFADFSAKGCKKPTVGISEDNIYTYLGNGSDSSNEQKRIGRWDQGHSAASKDAYLGN